MRTRSFVKTCLAALLVSQGVELRAQSAYYRATEVAADYSTGSYAIYANDLNNLGQVTGRGARNIGNNAFLWDPSTGYRDLFQGEGYALNDNGVVVGQSFNPGQAVIFQNGSQVLLQGAAGLDVNNAGTVVGLVENGNGVALGTPAILSTNAAPSFMSIAFGYARNKLAGIYINDAGTVAGSGAGGLATWTPSGGQVNLGLLPGTVETRASAINNAGDIAGIGNVSGGGFSAFIYQNGRGYTTLASISGSGNAAAWGINAQGDVVGVSDAGGSRHATLWLNGKDAVDLNSLGIPNRPNVTFEEAVGINDRGQILVTGRDPFKGERSWLLTICDRCGQITPNPNATSLEVGADWYDAFNEQVYLNNGSLSVVGTTLVNRHAGELRNIGAITVGSSGGLGTLINRGSIYNDDVAFITINTIGQLTNESHIDNRGDIRISGGLVNYGTWSNRGGNSLITQTGGAVWNSAGGQLLLLGAKYQQTGGDFQGFPGSTIVMSGATMDLAGTFTATRLAMQSDDGGVPSILTSRNRLELNAVTSLIGFGTEIRVEGGSASNVGQLILGAGSALTVSNTAFFQNAGGAKTQLQGDSTLNIKNFARAAFSGQLLAWPGTTIDVSETGILSTSGTVQADGNVFVRGFATYVGEAGSSTVFGVQSTVTVTSLSRMSLQSGGEMNFAGLVRMRGDAVISSAGDMTLKSSGTIVKEESTGIEVTAGHFTVDNGGLVTGGGSFRQMDGQVTINGRITATNLSFEAGSLNGSGTIVGNSISIGSGVSQSGPLSTYLIRPGNSPGTLTFEGAVSVDGAAFELEVADYRTFDRVVVNGSLNLQSALIKPVFVSGYVPDLDDALPFLQATELTLPGAIGQGTQLQAGTVSVDTSALPSGWSMLSSANANSLGSTLDYAAAYQLASVGAGESARIEAGAFGFQRGGTLQIDGLLEVSGRFTNRIGLVDAAGNPTYSAVAVGPQGVIAVLESGRVSNRSEWNNTGIVTNAGVFENRPGATFNNGSIFSSGSFVNTGRFQNDGSFNNFGTVVNEAGGVWINRGTIQNGGPWTNRGDMQNAGSVVNQSIFRNEGRFVILEGATFTGSGDFESVGTEVVVDGRLANTSITVYGKLSGRGHIAGRVLAGDVAPAGEGTGTLSFEGELAFDQLLLNLDALSFDRIVVNGGVTMNSISVFFAPGFTPGAGASFNFMLVTGTFTGFDTLGLYAYETLVQADGELVYVPWHPGEGLDASLTYGDGRLVYSVTAVPEPASWVLLACGLGGIFAWRHGRSRLRRDMTCSA